MAPSQLQATRCFRHKRKDCSKCNEFTVYSDSGINGPDDETPYNDSPTEGEPGIHPEDSSKCSGPGLPPDETSLQASMLTRLQYLIKPITRHGQNDQRVSVVVGSRARYDASEDMAKDANYLKLHICSNCQLAWLSRENWASGVDRGAHPHDVRMNLYCGISRTMHIWIGILFTSDDAATARGGTCVYFSPGSQYNMKDDCRNITVPVKQMTGGKRVVIERLGLETLARALDKILDKILHTRRKMAAAALETTDPDTVYDVTQFRLVINTDYDWIIDCMTQDFSKWTLNHNGLLIGGDHNLVKNAALYYRVLTVVNDLSLVRVRVYYNLVSAKSNGDALKGAEMAMPKPAPRDEDGMLYGQPRSSQYLLLKLGSYIGARRKRSARRISASSIERRPCIIDGSDTTSSPANRQRRSTTC